jgi:hypothetical protein
MYYFFRILSLLFLLTPQWSFAQNQTKVDSLLRLYMAAKPDTNKTKIINDLVNIHLYNDAQKLKHLLTQDYH